MSKKDWGAGVDANGLPIVDLLPDDFSLSDAFERLSKRPGCLWLDSASLGPIGDDGSPLGRYSFLMSDPIEQLVASENDADPWPTLAHWCEGLPTQWDPDLPPFQGGIAGLIGYESATWLEPVGRAAVNDLPTPAMSVGLYGWTIAVDHMTNKSSIIAQGIGRGISANQLEERIDLAPANPIRQENIGRTAYELHHCRRCVFRIRERARRVRFRY